MFTTPTQGLIEFAETKVIINETILQMFKDQVDNSIGELEREIGRLGAGATNTSFINEILPRDPRHPFIEYFCDLEFDSFKLKLNCYFNMQNSSDNAINSVIIYPQLGKVYEPRDYFETIYPLAAKILDVQHTFFNKVYDYVGCVHYSQPILKIASQYVECDDEQLKQCLDKNIELIDQLSDNSKLMAFFKELQQLTFKGLDVKLAKPRRWYDIELGRFAGFFIEERDNDFYSFGMTLPSQGNKLYPVKAVEALHQLFI